MKNYSILCLLLILGNVSQIFSQEKELDDREKRYWEQASKFKELYELHNGNLTMNKSAGVLLNSMRRFGYTEFTSKSSIIVHPNRCELIKSRQKNYDSFMLHFLWDSDKIIVPLNELEIARLLEGCGLPEKNRSKLDVSDFKKLAWVIKMNKKSYRPSEQIGISVSLHNISAEEVTILNIPSMPAFFLCSMKIEKIRPAENQAVLLTKEGTRLYDSGPFYDRGSKSSPKSVTLKPGDTVEIYNPIKTLNRYYDLSENGEYELTFFTRNFLGSDEEQVGEYPRPCTVRFKIEGYNNWLDDYVCWEEFEGNSPKESQDQ